MARPPDRSPSVESGTTAGAGTPPGGGTRVGRRGLTLLALVIVIGVLVVVGGLLLVSGLSSRGQPTALGTPRFTEVTDSAGIDQRYEGDFVHFVGGGVAAFDCDADRRPELLIAGGTTPAGLFHDDSAGGGSLAFSRLDRPELALTGVTGAYPLDIDSDGITDVALLRVGEDVLLRGLGGCRFERANEAWGFDGGDGWTTAFSATWEGDATWPTLAFGEYLGLADGEPDRSVCADGRLFRPTDGPVPYTTAIPLSPAWCSLSMLFSDWGRTGQRDLRVSNDRHYYSDYSDGEEQLWRMTAGQPPVQYTETDGWQRVRVEGMGIASEDVTGDGLPEVYLTSQAASRLETLSAGTARPTYRNMALLAGVEGAQPSTGDDHRPSTAWHPEWQDLNADGLVDLFVTKGNVSAQPDFATEDPNELYLGQPDGTFRTVAGESGLLDMDSSRGAVVADLDLDGRMDVVVVERSAPVRVWQGLGDEDGATGGATSGATMGHWVGISLRQDGANGDAIGAWVELRVDGRTQARERTVGGGHVSGQLGPMRFGLGTATSAEARVQWPDGTWGPWLPVEADRYLTITRDAPAAEAWTVSP